MAGATLLDVTVSDKINLQEKTLLSLDYCKIYFDFKKEDVFKEEQKINEIDCYNNNEVKATQEYLINSLLPIKRSQYWYISKAANSSILTDDINDLIGEALDSAEIFYALQLAPREEIELVVVNRLRNIEQVTAIYTQSYRSELQIIVFLNSENYDNDLMYKLLDIEYDLQKQIRNPLLAFSYIPGIDQNRREIVHPNANLIFKKII